VNDHLQQGRFGDEIERELLTETLPLALDRKATPDRRIHWRNRAIRLRQETFTWEAARVAMARRYFGGQSPFFPDVQDHLIQLTQDLDTLIERWNARTPAEERIALAHLRTQAEAQVEPLLQLAISDARHATLVFLGERSGEFRVERLVQYAELREGRP
jgi:hypothetical protein